MHVKELKVAEAPLVKVTVPVGVPAVPVEVSETIAVQVVGAFTATVAGVQVTLVEVVRLFTVRLKLPELETWSLSPE